MACQKHQIQIPRYKVVNITRGVIPLGPFNPYRNIKYFSTNGFVTDASVAIFFFPANSIKSQSNTTMDDNQHPFFRCITRSLTKNNTHTEF